MDTLKKSKSSETIPTGSLDTSIIIARWFDDNGEHNISIDDYRGLIERFNESVKAGNTGEAFRLRKEVAEIVFQRLYSRYLKPFLFDEGDATTQQFPQEARNLYNRVYKNGFSIMANCCLLIETLESFKEGLEDTETMDLKTVYRRFFNGYKDNTTEEIIRGDSAFDEIKASWEDLYSIRNGILHQGETKNGWTIRRDPHATKIVDAKVIQANLFAKALKRSLKQYQKTLETDERLWKNCLEKMKSIIKNCKTES